MFGLGRESMGSIVAALVAAVIALVGLIISKEQKTSEFRQAWIEGLRNDIAELISLCEAVRGDVITHGETPIPEAWGEAKTPVLAMEIVHARIQMRLNPDEKTAKVLLIAIRKHQAILSHTEFALRKTMEPIIAAAQMVLKDEWERVKRGEPVFFVVKWGLAIAVGFFLVFLILLGGGAVLHSFTS